MWVFNFLFGKIFDAVFWPFRGPSPWPAMVAISFLVGLLLLFVFRHVSNQEGIRGTKNKIKAHLLEFRLYKDSLSQPFISLGKIMLANFKYIGFALKPLAVMIVPLFLILIQLNLWFESRPLEIGKTALLKIKLAERADPRQTAIELEAPPGIAVETPPLRIEDEREIDWRLRAEDWGVHTLKFRWNGVSFTKSVVVGQNHLVKIAAVKPGRSIWDEVFNAGEEPLPKNVPVQYVEITYPGRRMNFFGWGVHWLVSFFILSIVFGFAFKGVLKVEI
jgi:hypothetical protein